MEDPKTIGLEEEPPLLYSTSAPSRCGFKTALPLSTQQVPNWGRPGQVFARGKFSFDYSSSIVGQVAPPVGQRDLSIQDAVATCFSDVEKSPFGQCREFCCFTAGE
ncbi:hypothetical protein J6590_079512 [Homalodisca vitripennis]|nr:hypothetical protein J6590_079512 [Homalodisca vitripennis]